MPACKRDDLVDSTHVKMLEDFKNWPENLLLGKIIKIFSCSFMIFSLLPGKLWLTGKHNIFV